MAKGIAKGAFPITPGEALPERAYGLYVQGAGTITFNDGDGEEVVAFPVASNSYHPFEVLYITSATATGIWGLKRHGD